MIHIKNAIDAMSEDERFFAAAYLKHLFQVNDPAHKAMLSERMSRMDEGKKFTMEQLERLHESLSAEGL